MGENREGEDRWTEGAVRMSVERSDTILMRPVHDLSIRRHFEKKKTILKRSETEEFILPTIPPITLFDFGTMIRRGRGFGVHRLGGASSPARQLKRNEGERGDGGRACERPAPPFGSESECPGTNGPWDRMISPGDATVLW